jgi:DNA polymerase-3 subunit delta'
LFEAVVGQEAAVSALRAAARQPVHAYLLVGAMGNGGLAAAHGFAASVLCPDGGCGVCRTCQQVLAGSHPDLHMVHRSGASLSVDDMRKLVTVAQRRPLQAARQVAIVTDVHLGAGAAPALLKTLEEPPGDTVFVLLADAITPGLSTVASRCVEVAFPPVPRTTLMVWLRERGASPEVATVVADASGGNPDRARVMMDDAAVAERAELWSSVPDQLTGSGDVVAQLVRRLLESTDGAVEPLKAVHALELERLTEEAKEMGERGVAGRKEITDHFAREERRWRADTLRAGLGAMARVYGARVRAQLPNSGISGERQGRSAATAVSLITDAARILPRNPNEGLLLHSLLVRLGSLEF